MRLSSIRYGRLVALAAVITVALAAAVAPPAAAAEPTGGCWLVGGPYPAGPEIDLDGDGNPDARLPHPGATLCVNVHTGIGNVSTFTCYGGLHSCDLWITPSHEGSAAVDAKLCVQSPPDVDPVCTTVDSGTIPLIPLEPDPICIGWSLTTSCMPRHR